MDVLFWVVGDGGVVTGVCGSDAVRGRPKNHRPGTDHTTPSTVSPEDACPPRKQPSLGEAECMRSASGKSDAWHGHACLQVLQLVSGCLQLWLPTVP